MKPNNTDVLMDDVQVDTFVFNKQESCPCCGHKQEVPKCVACYTTEGLNFCDDVGEPMCEHCFNAYIARLERDGSSSSLETAQRAKTRSEAVLFDTDVFDEMAMTLDLPDGWDSNFTISGQTVNYGSKTRCGKIVRKYNYRNDNPERYVSRIYQELSAECAKANKQVVAQGSLTGVGRGTLSPTCKGDGYAYEFAVGKHDGDTFTTEFIISVPITGKKG